MDVYEELLPHFEAGRFDAVLEPSDEEVEAGDLRALVPRSGTATRTSTTTT